MSYAIGVTSGTADKISAVTSNATATLDVVVDVIDKDNGAPPVITCPRTTTVITGSGTNKITTDPVTNHEAVVRAISVVNTHATLSQIVKITRTLGAGTAAVVAGPWTLLPGEKMEYTGNGAWVVYDANGGQKTAQPAAQTVIVLTASGTYTPSPGAKAAFVELWGGGGAGGGAATVASGGGAGGGGAAGGKVDKLFSPASALTVVIGAGGTGVSAADGNAGSDSTAGSLTAKGGLGGKGMASGTTILAALGGATGGTGSGGDLNSGGAPGAPGTRLSGTVGVSGAGASSLAGAGANGLIAQGTGAAASANTAAGGSGSLTLNNGGATVGGAGGSGFMRVTEYY